MIHFLTGAMASTVLSTDVLRQLSTGSGDNYIFDFSVIHADHYESLFRTLQRFAVQSVNSIGFSCDRLASCQSEDNLPPTVLSSIAHTKTHYIRNMVELLCYVVPKSTRLTSLHFSNLRITPDYLERMSVALGKSRVLRALHFSKVELRDDGLSALLLNLNPNTLESIEIVQCHITVAAVNDILKFISRRTKVGIGLRAFEVSPSEIPDADRRRISIAVSGRSSPSSPVAVRLAAEEEESDETEIDVTGIERRGRIAQLLEENKVLTEQIKALKEMGEAVRVNDSVFVVGRGAPDFVIYLNDIDQRLVTLDSQQRL
jgi:hypothetical protein